MTKDELMLKGKECLKEFIEYSNAFNVFPERKTEIEMLMYALLTKEHVLFKGLPGTAKSMLSMTYLGNIKGAKLFKQQFTSFMDEAYIFGPQLIDELKKGVIKHNTQNSLVDCDFAFLDEFFNANEETIIACNEALNERTFTRNGQQEKCKLVTAIMTTNQERENEKKLKPIYDRIMFSVKVLKVEGKNARMDMYINALKGNLTSLPTFEKEKLDLIHEYLEKSVITIQPGIFEVFDGLLNLYQEQSGLIISDRKAIKSLMFLKIIALIKGRNHVEFSDLEKLKLIWAEGNNAKFISVFDASYAKIKKEFAKIEKETKFLASADATYKNILAMKKDAIGYQDLKKSRSLMEAFIKESNVLIADIGEGSSKDKLMNMVAETQKMLSDVTKEIREFTKAGTASEDQEDTFSFFENIAKGKPDTPTKKSNIDDILGDNDDHE